MDKAFLRDVDLFSSLGDSELQEIADLSNLRQIPAGSAVVREGDTGDDLYIIKSGTLCVSAVQECGRDAKVGGLEASDFFGEMALLTGANRSATVMALVATEIIEIPGKLMREVLYWHPEVAAKLEQAMNSRRQDATSPIYENA